MFFLQTRAGSGNTSFVETAQQHTKSLCRAREETQNPWERLRKRNQKGLSFFGVGVENVDKKENERRGGQTGRRPPGTFPTLSKSLPIRVLEERKSILALAANQEQKG